MGSSYSEDNNYFKLELVYNEDSQILKDIDDVILTLKTASRRVKYRIEQLENKYVKSSETDKEIAVLIRQNQYLEAILQKDKKELESIFFPNGKNNCVIPDIFMWYQEPES